MTTMRRISRRDLLGLGAAAGMVAMSGTPAHAVPERGGSLRLGLAGRGLGDFDGRRPFDPIMRIAGHGAAFDCLTEIGADGAIRGELATVWEASPDARVWSIRLREDAVFHDGRPFGAADAVATLRLHARGSAAAVSGRILQVRKAGPHEVQVTLRDGTPGLPFLLADPQLVMLPADAPEAAMRAGIGTGLYRLESGRTMDRAVLRRVDRHWKDGAAGWFERVELLRIQDPAARLGALKTGRVDAVNLADPGWSAEARRHGRIVLSGVSGPAHLELAVEGADPDRAQAAVAAVAAQLDRRLLALAVPVPGIAGESPPEIPAPDLAVSVRIAPTRVPGAAALEHAVRSAAERAGLQLDDMARARIVARVRPGRPTPDWPAPSGQGAVAAVGVQSLMAHATRLHHPSAIGALWDMDSARIAERWWYA